MPEGLPQPAELTSEDLQAVDTAPGDMPVEPVAAIEEKIPPAFAEHVRSREHQEEIADRFEAGQEALQQLFDDRELTTGDSVVCRILETNDGRFLMHYNGQWNEIKGNLDTQSFVKQLENGPVVHPGNNNNGGSVEVLLTSTSTPEGRMYVYGSQEFNAERATELFQPEDGESPIDNQVIEDSERESFSSFTELELPPKEIPALKLDIQKKIEDKYSFTVTFRQGAPLLDQLIGEVSIEKQPEKVETFLSILHPTNSEKSRPTNQEERVTSEIAKYQATHQIAPSRFIEGRPQAIMSSIDPLEMREKNGHSLQSFDANPISVDSIKNDAQAELNVREPVAPFPITEKVLDISSPAEVQEVTIDFMQPKNEMAPVVVTGVEQTTFALTNNEIQHLPLVEAPVVVDFFTTTAPEIGRAELQSVPLVEFFIESSPALQQLQELMHGSEQPRQIILPGEVAADGKVVDATILKIEASSPERPLGEITYEFRSEPEPQRQLSEPALREKFEQYHWAVLPENNIERSSVVVAPESDSSVIDLPSTVSVEVYAATDQETTADSPSVVSVEDHAEADPTSLSELRGAETGQERLAGRSSSERRLEAELPGRKLAGRVTPGPKRIGFEREEPTMARIIDIELENNRPWPGFRSDASDDSEDAPAPGAGAAPTEAAETLAA